MTPRGHTARRGRAEPADVDLPAPLAEAIELLAGESPASRTFLGALVLGALVGAVVAGATFARHRALAPGVSVTKR